MYNLHAPARDCASPCLSQIIPLPIADASDAADGTNKSERSPLPNKKQRHFASLCWQSKINTQVQCAGSGADWGLRLSRGGAGTAWAWGTGCGRGGMRFGLGHEERGWVNIATRPPAVALKPTTPPSLYTPHLAVCVLYISLCSTAVLPWYHSPAIGLSSPS